MKQARLGAEDKEINSIWWIPLEKIFCYNEKVWDEKHIFHIRLFQEYINSFYSARVVSQHFFPFHFLHSDISPRVVTTHDSLKHVSLQCVPIKGLGFRRGSYKCECRRGFYFPNVTSPLKYFNGSQLEEEYENKFHVSCARDCKFKLDFFRTAKFIKGILARVKS